MVAVVLNWNAAEETIECVRSLLSSSYRNLRIVIVDNASTDDSVECLATTFPSLNIVSNSINSGYAGGNNLGITWALHAGAEYILIVNNDVVVDTHLIMQLVEKIRIDKKVGIVTGKVYYKDNHHRVYSGAGRFDRWRCSGVNKGTMFDRMSSDDKDREVSFVSGVLFLARAEIFTKIGLLDEKYFMYFEDLDFSRKVSKQYSLLYTPQAIAYHKSGGGTHWGNYSQIYLYYHTRNRFIVFEHEKIYYKYYVVLFTICVTFAKALVILSFSFLKSKGDVKKRIYPLWKGIKEGILYYAHRDHVVQVGGK